MAKVSKSPLKPLGLFHGEVDKQPCLAGVALDLVVPLLLRAAGELGGVEEAEKLDGLESQSQRSLLSKF